MIFRNFTNIIKIYNSYKLSFYARKKSDEVINFQLNLENNLNNFQKKLINFNYIHSHYRSFIVCDSKKRLINSPKFEDHILHHLVHSILYDIFDKKFFQSSFANRNGFGSHRAVLDLFYNSKKYSYFLKMDITKYFQSIEHNILYSQIKRYVNCDEFLYYVKLIIESYSEKTIKNPLTNNLTGMPIGKITSQLFANIYLHDLDFYVHMYLKPMFRKKGNDLYYVRYVDDFVFLSNSKKDLILVRKLVLNFLSVKLKLSVSNKKLILNSIKCGIPFLGYIIFKTHLKIMNNTIRRFKRKIKKYDFDSSMRALLSFKGHLDLANKNLFFSLRNSLLLRFNGHNYKYQEHFFNLYGTKTWNKDMD